MGRTAAPDGGGVREGAPRRDSGTEVPLGRRALPDGAPRQLRRRGGAARAARARRDGGYDDGHAGTSPAGSFEPNAFGLFDVPGNAWEWCSDRYDAAYYGRSPERDPQGPESGASRALRGGGWQSTGPVVLRCAFRFEFRATFLNFHFGFRAARGLE